MGEEKREKEKRCRGDIEVRWGGREECITMSESGLRKDLLAP